MILSKKIIFLTFGFFVMVLPIKASAVNWLLCESQIPNADYTPPYK